MHVKNKSWIHLSLRAKLLDSEQFAYFLSWIPLGNLMGILSPKGTIRVCTCKTYFHLHCLTWSQPNLVNNALLSSSNIKLLEINVSLRWHPLQMLEQVWKPRICNIVTCLLIVCLILVSSSQHLAVWYYRCTTRLPAHLAG